MRVFLDSANLEEIEGALQRGFISGITTNPSLLAKEPKTAFIQHIRKIASLCENYGQKVPLSVEVFTRHAREMVDQACDIVDRVKYEPLNIKIPIGWAELEVIYQLGKKGIKTNCTCMFTEAQCMLAANAGASFVSIFFARLKDIGGNPQEVIANTRKLLDQAKSTARIIVGSIRHPRDITDSQLAGAHIVTAGHGLFAKMATHPQTTVSVEGFLKDFEAWLS